MNFTVAGLIPLVATLFLSSCTTTEQTKAVTLPPEMVITNNQPVQEPTDGSLWPGNSNQNLLFTDNKARKINDLVTVNVVETAAATGNATTATSGASDNSFGITSMFGLQRRNDNSFLGAAGAGGTLNTTSATAYDGSGSTTKNASFTTTISAVVTKVLPNGNLQIKGSRMITLNNDTQLMQVEGIIRPSDIAFDNSISSSQIAEAKIFYTGSGVIADKQGQGWGIQVMDKIWPF